MIKKMDSKAQLSLGDAPGVVLIVLFLFMCMGTAAFVLDKYGEAFGSDNSNTVINETLTVGSNGVSVAGASICNAEGFAVTTACNTTDGLVIQSGNYTIVSATGFLNVTAAGSASSFNGTSWEVSYTYTSGGIACNITEDLTEEVEDNTSIAGMVLTIALIGIVLSILIGLFYVFTGRKGM